MGSEGHHHIQLSGAIYKCTRLIAMNNKFNIMQHHDPVALY